MIRTRKKKKERNIDPFTIQEGSYKRGGLNYPRRYHWTEESFVSDSGEKEIIGLTFDFGKLSAIMAVVFLFLIVLLTRTAWLQLFRGDYYYTMAEGNRIRIDRIEANRGIIYDRQSVPLVGNRADFLLYILPADLPKNADERTGILHTIGDILQIGEIDRIITELDAIEIGSLESFQPIFIADNIEYEKAMLLYLRSFGWPGIVLSSRTRREYLPASIRTQASGSQEPTGADANKGYGMTNGMSLSHILGYTGKISEEEFAGAGDEYLPIDYIGKMGVEFFWESDLRGMNGRKQIEVDALGKEKKIISREDGEDGHNLVLSFDVRVQRQLEEFIRDHLSELNLSRACAIILDPHNGEILAMVSLPAFDNNMFARGITREEYDRLIADPDKPLFNRCISGEYPSGSTIKPVIAAAALDEGLITEHTSFFSTGGLRIGEWFFPDWLAGGHGVVDVRRSIAESVNTFFYYIGGGYEDFRGLGVERIAEYAGLFGLGRQTGVDLAGESDGLVPTKEWKEKIKGESWYIGDTYHLAIGQGDILVTPLQVAAYTGVFANGGSLYRPHLIKQILSSDDKLISNISETPVRRNFIDDYNITVVRQGMRRTVTSGSAQSLASVSVTVAGKTGTAQWSSKKEPHAWFTGFAPYDDPEVVITILIEEGGEGSRTAVPVVREFLEWYFLEFEK